MGHTDLATVSTAIQISKLIISFCLLICWHIPFTSSQSLLELVKSKHSPHATIIKVL